MQRLEQASDNERFDLVIATNILIYYDVFEQSLALSNIARMLRPGGWLLTNTPLFELPETRLREMGASGHARVADISWDHVIDRLTESLR